MVSYDFASLILELDNLLWCAVSAICMLHTNIHKTKEYKTIGVAMPL